MATLTDLAKKGKDIVEDKEGQRIWMNVVDLAESHTRGAVILCLDKSVQIIERLAHDLPNDDTEDTSALMLLAIFSSETRQHNPGQFDDEADVMTRRLFEVLPEDRYIMGLFIYVLLKATLDKAGER